MIIINQEPPPHPNHSPTGCSYGQCPTEAAELHRAPYEMLQLCLQPFLWAYSTKFNKIPLRLERGR